MKAIGLYRNLPIDDPESLVDLDVPKPAPSERELLVEVKAISVNPVDYKIRARPDPSSPQPRILGWDASGIVREVGAGVQLFKPGDEVYYAGSIQKPGAEYHVVDERIVGHKPRTLGFAASAALPLTTLTAWEGLFDRFDISSSGADRGKSLLLIGAAGGVGSIAIQLAKKLAGLRVVGTASRPESSRWVKELGADAVVDHTGDLAAQMKAAGIPEAGYVFCLTDATPYFPRFAPLAANLRRAHQLLERGRTIGKLVLEGFS